MGKKKQNIRNEENVYPRGKAFSDELIINYNSNYRPKSKVYIPTIPIEKIIKQGTKRRDAKRNSKR